MEFLGSFQQNGVVLFATIGGEEKATLADLTSCKLALIRANEPQKAEGLGRWLKGQGIFTVLLCKDMQGDGEVPSEVVLKPLCEQVDMLLLLQEEQSFSDAEAFLIGILCYGNEKVDEDRLKSLINSGFAYYTGVVREREWDILSPMDFAIFDSLFRCPIYTANAVFMGLYGGEEFTDLPRDKSDAGLMKNYLKDYIKEGALKLAVYDHPKEKAPFDIEVNLLFTRLDEDAFSFNEENQWVYPKAENQVLQAHIDRKLCLPFRNMERQKKLGLR